MTAGAQRGPGRDVAAAAVLGALQTVAFVHTVWAWPLPLAATAWLAWRAGAAGPRRAALLGLAFGTGWLAAGTWWLFVSMHRYGSVAAPLAALAVLLLALALSLYLALALAAWARWRPGGIVADALLFGACWLLAELARAELLTGFPWVASGYAQVDSPLARLAPLVGVYGMGFAGAALAAAAVRSWRAAGAAVLVLAALWATPQAVFTRAAGSLGVALLQPDVAQDDKFAPDRIPAALAWISDTMLAADADLVVAPETAIPLLPAQLTQLDPELWPALERHFARPGRAALVGVPLGDYEHGYTNSAVGLSAAPPYRYDKHHLVPFGEFIPPGFRWFTDVMAIPLGDFTRGPLVPPPFVVGGQRVAPNICYEDLFGEELARRFADPATAPTIFVNLSNIGWFGDTAAIPQHLAISRLRSLEFERPMLRATNTGATAIVDHLGRVVERLAPFTRGVLSGEVQGRQGLTPYASWAGAWGLAPLWAAGALAIGWAAFGKARRSRSRP